MSHLILGTVGAFLAFTVLGAGISIFLSSSRRGIGFAIGVAPAIGFVLVAILGTYLTLLDIPVEKWAISVLVAGSVLNVLLMLWRRPFDTSLSPPDRRSTLWGAGGFALTLVLTLAPQAIGGLQYTVLRGNGWDSFNYVAAADYLDREPLSWAERTDSQTLVNRDQSYGRARMLLTTRWSTFVMLAFASRVGGLSPINFEYSFSLICLLIGYGPAFLYARCLGLRPSYAALTAAAISLGFWAQLIVDTRAQSQLNSIPVVTLITLLISGIETKRVNAIWLDYALVGLGAAALSFLYVEIVPLIVLALLIFLLSRTIASGFSFRAILNYCFSIMIALVCASPMASFLYGFGASQLSFAASTQNNWHLLYYNWLYSNPLAGFWGFAPSTFNGTPLSEATSVLVTILGSALTILFVFALLKAFRTGGPSPSLAACMSLAAGSEFAFLAARGQLWAAAKALSFGYAFFILCLAGYCLADSGFTIAASGRPSRKLATGCALIFLIYQNVLGGTRFALAFSKHEFPNYITHHPDYRSHTWDLTTIAKAIEGQRGLTIWSAVSDEWFSEYLDFALPRTINLVNLGANLDANQLHVPRQERSQVAQYLLVDRAGLRSADSGSSSNVIAATSDLLLLRASQGGVVLTSVKNPNGIENGFFWMGDDPTIFYLWSSADACATFAGNLRLGPSSNLQFRTLVIGNADKGGRPSAVVYGGFAKWQVPVRVGINEIPIAVKERATKYLSNDSRSLMLRVEGLKVEGTPCEDRLP